MLKPAVLMLAVAGLLAAFACGGGGTKANAQVFPVQVDGKTTGFTAAFTAYFPNDVQAHAGDTVQFTSVFNGDTHTVTLGKDVDDVIASFAQACPNGGVLDPNCADRRLPQQYADQYAQLDSKLPYLLPVGYGGNGALERGPLADANQGAAQPCFLATGDPPSDGSACAASEQQPQPAFDGTQTYYNSGWLEDQAVYSVKLADNIAPGTYHFYCLVHREEMSGTITVVDKAAKVATPAEVKKKGTDDLTALAAKLKPGFDRLASLTPDNAQAGGRAAGAREASVDEFGPKEIGIPVGGSVTWTLLGGAHSISFNAPEDARPVLVKGSDAGYHVNTKGAAPAGGPGQPARDPNAAPNSPIPGIDAGPWDGQGFHSSGYILFRGTPFPTYKLTFSTAGTYPYICLIHPDMEGTVKVVG